MSGMGFKKTFRENKKGVSNMFDTPFLRLAFTGTKRKLTFY
jgi:hypothetical protein